MLQGPRPERTLRKVGSWARAPWKTGQESCGGAATRVLESSRGSGGCLRPQWEEDEIGWGGRDAERGPAAGTHAQSAPGGLRRVPVGRARSGRRRQGCRQGVLGRRGTWVGEAEP